MRKLYYTNTEKKLSLNIDRELFIVNEKVTKYKDDFWLRLHNKIGGLVAKSDLKKSAQERPDYFCMDENRKKYEGE